MRKWLTVGAVAMFVAWLPFLYAELTSEEAERKDRTLPTEEGAEEGVETQPVDDEPGARAGGTAEAPAAQVAPAAAPPSEAPEDAPAEEPPVAPNAPGEPGATAQAPPEVAAAVGEAPDEAPDEAEGEGEGEGEPEPEAPTASGPLAVLRQAFERQPRDALWAGDTEHTLRGLFGTADVPAELLSEASCRSSVCRVDVKWTPKQATAYVSIYEASTRLSGTELGIEPVGEADEHGEQRVQLYVTRQGYTMADLAR